MVISVADVSPVLGNRHHANFCAVEGGAAVRMAPEVLGWRTDSGERPTDEWLGSKGFYGLIETPQPAVNDREETAQLAPIAAWQVDDDLKTVRQVWIVAELSEAETAEIEVGQAAKVRTRRMQLLFLSDYTQVLDFAGNREMWAAYRQALRDVPAQAGFPWDIQWPEEPRS